MNIFSRKFDKEQPPSEKCLDCGEMIEAQYFGEYGWIYICEKCETSWEA
jgi:Zn finger protein HypA/HybF involved in hydrogenase expression